MGRFSARFLAALVAGLLVLNCAATTTLQSVPAGATLDVKTSSQSALPRTEKYQVTTFGNFEFQAKTPGAEPFYGLLPLKFNGGYLALDILFLAPLAFANLRSVYPFYEIDLEKRVVRYKRKEADPWIEYMPKPPEAERARKLFAE